MREADRRLKFDATTSIANEIIEQERAARAAKTARLREARQQAEAESEKTRTPFKTSGLDTST